MELKTPFYDRHIKYGGKMVPFAGYSLPVQFAGLVAEHLAVRKSAGLFDVSHMTEIFIEGKDAIEYINMVFSNDFSKMEAGRVRYTLLLNENGGLVDDMVIYKENDEKFVMVGNGSNRQKDYDWLLKYKKGNVTITDNTDKYAQLALQGPNSRNILKAVVSESDIPEKYYSYKNGKFNGADVVVSRTGYTGELGYELYIGPEKAGELWDAILEAGKEYDLALCGLGARDTLRLEASMPLYGNDTSDETNPLEADLGFVVKMDKADFVGKAALSAYRQKQKRIGMKVTGKGIIRGGCPLYVGDKQIGITTSGTLAPYLGYPIAMGYVDLEFIAPGTKLSADVRGKRVEAEIVEMPFYKK